MPMPGHSNVTTCRLGIPFICDSEPKVCTAHAQQLLKLFPYKTRLWAPAPLTPAASVLQGADTHPMARRPPSFTSALPPSIEARGCLATLRLLAVKLFLPVEQVRGAGHSARPLHTPAGYAVTHLQQHRLQGAVTPSCDLIL